MDTRSSDIQAGLSSMGLYVVAGQTAIFVTQTCLDVGRYKPAHFLPRCELAHFLHIYKDT